MKLTIKRFVILFGIIISLMSCSKVFDDITQYKSLDPSMVWTDQAYTTQYLNVFYSGLYNNHNKNDAPATEEFGLWQQNVWTTFFSDQIAAGSSSGIQAYTSFSSAYSQIRDLNRFFENVDQGTYAGKKYLKGQAFFMLAHWYFRLVRTYGGVPIVKGVISASNPDPQALGQPRNSTLECFNYITQLLDSAIVNLPEPSAPGATITGYERFRVTKPVAMIVKGEVLMWKASPVFCTTPNATYWTDAYNAMSAAKTWLDSKGYGLYTTSNGATPPFTQMFYDKVGAKKEWIWAQEFSYPTTTPGSLWTAMRPPQQGGDGEAAAPTYNLVTRYMMADGKDTVTSSFTYDRKLYWKNRDPRFKQTIAYNGSRYGFPSNPTALPNPNRREWTFFGVTVKGDKPFDPTTRGGGFGFLNRKGIDTTLHNQQLDKLVTDWPIYRYAEVLLNMAECAVETGKYSEVKGYMTPIRARAGILNRDGSYGLASVPDNRTTWIKIIMNERLVELAYEGKRVWDIKRRVLFSDFKEYKYLLGLQAMVNDAGVDALKLKVPRNGATIVLAKLSSLSLAYEDVWKALSDTMATTANPDQLYQQIMTDRVIIGDGGKVVLNPWDQNALEPIPSATLLTDPKVEQSKDYGGPFNPKLN
jgi:hypothetical protein